MMKIGQIGAALALAGAAAVAPAADERWGVHDGFDVAVGSGLGAGTSISDSYSFSLGAASTLITSVISLEGDAGALDLSGGTVSLFSGDVGSGRFVGAFAFDSQAVTMSIAPLLPGLYYYLVTGIVGSGALAGVYALASRAVPVLQVPEPDSLPLLLAGLAAVGFVAARRRQPVR